MAEVENKNMETEMNETVNQEVDEAVEAAAEERNTQEPTEAATEEVADDAASEDAEKEAAGATLKEKLFGKKDSKEAKLQEQIDELNDKVVRQMAEFDNYRKRTEKEKQQMFETGARSVIEKVLPVIDNFERGFAALPEEQKSDSFAEGMSMVYKQLMTELEKIEVKPIEAVGKEFDPNLHNAVMHVDDDSLGENVVAEELQKGYTYRDTVVRHSMVKVAN